MTNPDLPCPHEDFVASVEVNQLTASDDDPGVIGYSADITVRCAQCEEPFRWTGLQAGLSATRPMCNLDETVMSAPLRPASADPDFGLGLPGYAIGYRPGPGVHEYLSTGCLHGDLVLSDGRTGHGYCQGETGAAGAKVPATCKHCGSRCICVCHGEAS